VHAAETSVEKLTNEYLPLLLHAAGAVSADWARYQAAPQVTVPARAGVVTAAQPKP
jgi:IclR family transcriptional regulator, pca regulon regulatory protein